MPGNYQQMWTGSTDGGTSSDQRPQVSPLARYMMLTIVKYITVKDEANQKFIRSWVLREAFQKVSGSRIKKI